MWILYGILGFIVALIVLAVFSETFRGWIMIVWHWWFRDSEINLAADAATLVGVVNAAAQDPEFTQLLGHYGVGSTTLMTIGLVLRALRASRDVSMIPLTKPPGQ